MIVWCSVNEELYFFWHLSWKSVEGNMSNVGGHPFGMVIQANFFDGGLLF